MKNFIVFFTIALVGTKNCCIFAPVNERRCYYYAYYTSKRRRKYRQSP